MDGDARRFGFMIKPAGQPRRAPPWPRWVDEGKCQANPASRQQCSLPIPGLGVYMRHSNCTKPDGPRWSGECRMAKPGNGSGEERGQAGGGPPMAADKIFPFLPRTPERALVISSALTIVSFLSHIFFLFLVDPWRVLNISKESALAYSTIPLCFGVIFVLYAIYSFIRIESRSSVHVIVLLFAAIFGSFSVHGLLGFVHHYLNLIVLSTYGR